MIVDMKKSAFVLFPLLSAGVGLAGERLYNGIELPEAWPQQEVTELNQAVQRVPYLEQRPGSDFQQMLPHRDGDGFGSVGGSEFGKDGA